MKQVKTSIVGLVFAGLCLAPVLAKPGASDLLKRARVTKAQAEKIALAGVRNGKIKSAELEKEGGLLIWSFDIARPGTKNLTEVWVDAQTGKIASLSVETRKDQAREAAADKAKK